MEPRFKAYGKVPESSEHLKFYTVAIKVQREQHGV